MRRTETALGAGEEGGSRARVLAQVEVDLRAVLVGRVADRVALDGAEVVDGDLDGLLGHGTAVGVGVDGERVASAASGARALTGAGAELAKPSLSVWFLVKER